MNKFKCIECGKQYDEGNIPLNGVCQEPTCPGSGLTGLIIPDEDSNQPQSGLKNKEGRETGLCILLMDASGSMAEEPYSTSFPSKYPVKAEATGYAEKNGKLTKREVVTDIAAQAIIGLKSMSKKEDAYICIIKFDHTQSVVLTESVETILSKYPDAAQLAKYLYSELSSMNGGTDINSALTMANAFVEKFINGEVPGMSNCIPNVQNQFIPARGLSIDVPNVRVLIYTDGEQLPSFGPIVNPFKANDPDVLIGAFIGSESDNGCSALKDILSTCPVHNVKQFYVLDSPTKAATLRGLFRMASGTSGFCPNCITML